MWFGGEEYFMSNEPLEFILLDDDNDMNHNFWILNTVWKTILIA